MTQADRVTATEEQVHGASGTCSDPGFNSHSG